MSAPKENILSVVNSHISSEFVEAAIPCTVHSPNGCDACGYDGDLFSPTHIAQCSRLRGVTTPANGHESTESWWTKQDADASWLAQWDDDEAYEDDKREDPRSLMADLFGDDE